MNAMGCRVCAEKSGKTEPQVKDEPINSRGYTSLLVFRPISKLWTGPGSYVQILERRINIFQAESRQIHSRDSQRSKFADLLVEKVCMKFMKYVCIHNQSQCLILQTQMEAQMTTGTLCMLSSKESIQVGMKVNDTTLTQHAQIPGLFPSIRKERYGRGEKRKPQFYMDGGIQHTQLFCFGMGTETKASGTLSMPKEPHHQPPALKATVAKKIQNCITAIQGSQKELRVLNCHHFILGKGVKE